MTFELLMRDLGERLGLEEFQAVDGSAHLISENGTVTFLEVPETECVLMTAFLGKLPADDSSQLLRAMMCANFLFRGTRGGTLGLDESTGEFTVVRFDRLELLDGASYLERVHDFVAVMIKWREAVAGFIHGEDQVETDDMASQGFALGGNPGFISV